MIVADARFAAAVRTSNTRRLRGTLHPPLGAGTPVPVVIRDGEVVADRDRTVHRIVTATVVPQVGAIDLVPRTTSSPTHPVAAWLFVPELGVLHPDGSTSWVKLGTFRVHDPRALASLRDGVSVTFAGSDLARTVQRYRFTGETTLEGNLRQVVVGIVAPRLAAFRDALPAAFETITVPSRVVGPDDDPFAVAREAAAASAFDLRFDVDGVLVAPPLTPGVDVRDLTRYVTEVDRSLDDGQLYNHVVVTGEHPETEDRRPVRAEVWDDDPASPTFAGNPLGSSAYGAVTRFYVSQFLTNQEQADETALATLARSLRVTEAARVAYGPVDATLEPGDVVSIDHPPSGLSGRFVIEAHTIPLDLARDGSLELRRL